MRVAAGRGSPFANKSGAPVPMKAYRSGSRQTVPPSEQNDADLLAPLDEVDVRGDLDVPVRMGH